MRLAARARRVSGEVLTASRGGNSYTEGYADPSADECVAKTLHWGRGGGRERRARLRCFVDVARRRINVETGTRAIEFLAVDEKSVTNRWHNCRGIVRFKPLCNDGEKWGGKRGRREGP